MLRLSCNALCLWAHIWLSETGYFHQCNYKYLKMAVFWVVAPCGLVAYTRFRGHAGHSPEDCGSTGL
jgi:hypothetical protein